MTVLLEIFFPNLHFNYIQNFKNHNFLRQCNTHVKYGCTHNKVFIAFLSSLFSSCLLWDWPADCRTL